jgi:hypothetical protein
MRRFKLYIALWSITAFWFSALPSLDAQETQDWRELHNLIASEEGERAWELEIPWRIDLLQARRQAEESKRPIFLWEMDGHPLGCT